MSVRRVFKDERHQAFFEENGYIILPYVDEAEMDAFIKLLKDTDYTGKKFRPFQENFQHKHDMHGTFWDIDVDYRLEIFELIKEFYSKANELYLENYKFAQANVFIKYPNSGYIAPHQNLTILDESKYTSVSVSCPSIDTDPNKGGMLVVPGSHKKFETHRATNAPCPLHDIMNDYEHELWLPLHVKKGELLIIDDSIMHFTCLNKSQEERWAVHALLIPEETVPFICIADMDNNEMTIKKAEGNFLQVFMPGQNIDDLPTLEKFKWYKKAFTESEMRAILGLQPKS